VQSGLRHSAKNLNPVVIRRQSCGRADPSAELWLRAPRGGGAAAKEVTFKEVNGLKHQASPLLNKDIKKAKEHDYHCEHISRTSYVVYHMLAALQEYCQHIISKEGGPSSAHVYNEL